MTSKSILALLLSLCGVEKKEFEIGSFETREQALCVQAVVMFEDEAKVKEFMKKAAPKFDTTKSKDNVDGKKPLGHYNTKGGS